MSSLTPVKSSSNSAAAAASTNQTTPPPCGEKASAVVSVALKGSPVTTPQPPLSGRNVHPLSAKKTSASDYDALFLEFPENSEELIFLFERFRDPIGHKQILSSLQDASVDSIVQTAAFLRNMETEEAQNELLMLFLALPKFERVDTVRQAAPLLLDFSDGYIFYYILPGFEAVLGENENPEERELVQGIFRGHIEAYEERDILDVIKGMHPRQIHDQAIPLLHELFRLIPNPKDRINMFRGIQTTSLENRIKKIENRILSIRSAETIRRAFEDILTLPEQLLLGEALSRLPEDRLYGEAIPALRELFQTVTHPKLRRSIIEMTLNSLKPLSENEHWPSVANIAFIFQNLTNEYSQEEIVSALRAGTPNPKDPILRRFESFFIITLLPAEKRTPEQIEAIHQFLYDVANIADPVRQQGTLLLINSLAVNTRIDIICSLSLLCFHASDRDEKEAIFQTLSRGSSEQTNLLAFFQSVTNRELRREMILQFAKMLEKKEVEKEIFIFQTLLNEYTQEEILASIRTGFSDQASVAVRANALCLVADMPPRLRNPIMIKAIEELTKGLESSYERALILNALHEIPGERELEVVRFAADFCRYVVSGAQRVEVLREMHRISPDKRDVVVALFPLFEGVTKARDRIHGFTGNESERPLEFLRLFSRPREEDPIDPSVEALFEAVDKIPREHRNIVIKRTSDILAATDLKGDVEETLTVLLRTLREVQAELS